MKNTSIILLLVTLFPLVAIAQANEALRFDPTRFVEYTIDFPTGESVKYRAYEDLYYVANVVDSTYQTLGVFVPESAYTENKHTPIFLKTNIGGYMAAKASRPSAMDATGRALKEGYVVVIPGSRGANSMITDAGGHTVWTGRAPAGIVDLKAAVRYLRYNKTTIPGDTERIVSDGTSAGGAMSALLGATGNHPAYMPYLKDLGAAEERDDIFAAVCYCPITDLEHADMAYEWLFESLNPTVREITDEQKAVSAELAARYPAYLNSLQLRLPDGSPLTDANYLNYMKSLLMKSAQRAKNEGCDIPEESGVILNKSSRGSSGETVIDIDLSRYLQYVQSKRKLKTPPAFDAMGVAGGNETPENKVFGDQTGSAVNFTIYSLQKASGKPSVLEEQIIERVFLLNPMNFIGDGVSQTATNWYIRHGALDRDTAFPVPINLYRKLENNGYTVDFALPWNRNHAGDYNLDSLFEWISTIKRPL